MKISVVTPCRNAASHVAETVESVLRQRAVIAGRVTLEYVICDGASTDDTLRILEAYRCPEMKIISEPDRGMYDALAKGLGMVSGDVVAYINASDYYHPYAFDVIAQVFEDHKISWFTGNMVIYNEHGAIVEVQLPFRYRRRLFECGAYGRLLPFLQQENTVWRREMQKCLDLAALARCRLAGDFYVWRSFASKAEPYVVEAILGGFRKHFGQLSESLELYRKEIADMSREITILDRLYARRDRLIWNLPARWKKRFAPDRLLRYDHTLGRWA